MRRWEWVLILLVGLIGCGAPAARPPAGSEEARAAAGPKRLVAAIQSAPLTLNDRVRLAGVGIPGTSDLERLVNAYAAIPDERGELHAQVAEAVPSPENGLWAVLPDGHMETTWRIRPNAEWHDGVPVTADDFLFALTLGQDRELAIFRHPAYEFIEAAHAPDARTVTVVWSQPYIQADELFTASTLALPLPRHLLEAAYLADKATLIQLPYWNEEFVGSGPFKLRAWHSGLGVDLSANDRFVLKRPRVDEIEVKFIPSAPTIAANLLAGTTDVVLGRSLSLDQALAIRDRWTGGKVIAEIFSSAIMIYPQFIDASPPVVADTRFRKALMHALDREQMVEALQAGLAPVAHSFVGPNEPSYRDLDPYVVRYAYEPPRASAMIGELGFQRGADGVWRDPAGQRLSVEVRTGIGDDLREKTLLSVAAFWQRVGLAVDPLQITPQQAEGREFRATFPAFDIRRQPADLSFLERAHGSKTPLPQNRFTGNNYARYMNAEYDAMVDTYFVTIPRAERFQLLARIVQHTTDVLTVLTTFFQTSPSLISNRLVERSDGRPLDTWNVHEWEMRPV